MSRARQFGRGARRAASRPETAARVARALRQTERYWAAVEIPEGAAAVDLGAPLELEPEPPAPGDKPEGEA